MSPRDQLDPMVADQILDDLNQHGYSVSEGLLGRDHITALAAVALAYHESGRLVRARTGKVRAEDESVRGDSIAWFDDEPAEPAIVECGAIFDELRCALNRRLFLNLHDVESHFAFYPPGARYQKHLDQFASGDQRRKISLVLYLNESWLNTDGGQLRLFLDGADDKQLEISPTAGRLVLFESSRFWHEVLPTNQDRLSIAGWFRTRS